MKANDSTFELILQELLKQKHRLDELVKENQELRSQLAALREGRGISVDILGQTFSPAVDSPEPLATSHRPPVTDQAPDKAIYTTSSLDTSHNKHDHNGEESIPSPSPAFLEEMIFDELASAATSPLAIWNEPATSSSLQAEEEKVGEPDREGLVAAVRADQAEHRGR